MSGIILLFLGIQLFHAVAAACAGKSFAAFSFIFNFSKLLTGEILFFSHKIPPFRG